MTLPLPIFLLTDFGTHDTYVGQVKAVLSARSPGAPPPFPPEPQEAG